MKSAGRPQRQSAGGPGRGAAHLRRARHRAGDPRQARTRSRSRSSGGEIRFDGVRFAYANGASRAQRRQSRPCPAGKTRGAGRRLGRRQVDHPQSDPALLRRRPRARSPIDGQDVRDVTLASLRARDRAGEPGGERCSTTRSRANIAYGRFGASEAEIVAAAKRRRGRRVHPRAAPGLRHRGRRARRQALGRPAPAHRHRPRHAEERADPAARRGDLGARHRNASARCRRRSTS